MARQVSFTQMADGTPEEWALLDRFEAQFNAGLPDRILAAVDKLNGSYGGHRGTRYTHSLQAATRAMRDGKDEEDPVATPIHHIRDGLPPLTPCEIVAAALKPFGRD